MRNFVSFNCLESFLTGYCGITLNQMIYDTPVYLTVDFTHDRHTRLHPGNDADRGYPNPACDLC